MATAILAQQTIEEAHRMADQAHTWTPGRSKRDGRPFWIIPSRSVPGTAHWTTSYGCTCQGHRRHGDCAHAEAVRVVEARRLAEMLAEAPVPSLISYRDSMPGCVAGCGELVERQNERCYRCASHEAYRLERSQRRAAARAAVMSSWTTEEV